MNYTISFGGNGRKLPTAEFSYISKEEAEQLSRIKNDFDAKFVASRIEMKQKNPRQGIAKNFMDPKKREQVLSWQPASSLTR
ncbi:MAG: hypothetical protein JZU65_24540 [Chlorobium sp.]|nr:hypothetical protein [Chlorobium sp.]